MAAKRSSVVRAREGVGVTMIFWEPPLVAGAVDDSPVLVSNTSPEKEMLKLHKPTDGTEAHRHRSGWLTPTNTLLTWSTL